MTEATLPATSDAIAGTMQHINSTVLLDPAAYKQMMAVADFMSKGVATIPEHLRGKPSDCLAIVMQSMVWGLLPHVVAQKTFVTPGGIIGYEAQLVHAVTMKSGVLEGAPEFTFKGDWAKLRGKAEFVPEQDGGDGKKKRGGYWKSTWPKSDEVGLSVVVTATLKGEKAPRTYELFLSQCYPRFSTQWATDPEQQITYIGLRKFVRRYCPGVLMGIYTTDELDDIPPEQVDENTTRLREKPRPTDIKPGYPDDRFKVNLPKWRKSIEDRKNTPDSVIAMISGEYQLSKEQQDAIKAIVPKAEAEPANTTDTGSAQ